MRTEGAQLNVVEVKGVHTRFGDAVVHRDVNLELRRGEILAVIGGSGCGKSVLLREILRLMPVTEGEISLFSEDISTLSEAQLAPLRRRIGVLFQHAALFSSQTLLENVMLPLLEHTHLDPDTVEELARLRIAMVGLPEEAAGRFPAELSGGMRKRAGLARALALDPELLFLDEPTSGLDPVGANGLDDLIKDLAHAMGLTVLMVTHDLASLWYIADRIVMLGDAQVLASGTAEEVASVDHPLVQQFFSGPRGRAARAIREGTRT